MTKSAGHRETCIDLRKEQNALWNIELVCTVYILFVETAWDYRTTQTT